MSQARRHWSAAARFGLIASSKDRDLVNFGVLNDFQSTKRVKFGPWYGDDEHDYDGWSCRRLDTCVTEFGAQGLELDAALLAWGTDFVRAGGAWSNGRARGYKKGGSARKSVTSESVTAVYDSSRNEPASSSPNVRTAAW